MSSLEWGLALCVLITEMRLRAYFLSSLSNVLFPVISTCQQHNKSAGLPCSAKGLIMSIRGVPMVTPGFQPYISTCPHKLSFPVLFLWTQICVSKNALKPFCLVWVCFIQTNHSYSSMFFHFSGLSISVFLWAPHETHGSCLLPVNSFGDDEEPCTSSDSDEEVIKQFEISVSRSQSFHTEASEKGKQVVLEQKSKFSHLLSTHEEDNTEVSACEGILCMKPFLYLEQGWTMVRTPLSPSLYLYLRVQGGRENEARPTGWNRVKGFFQTSQRGCHARKWEKEWIRSTKILTPDLWDPSFLPYRLSFCIFWTLMARINMVFIKLYKISISSDKYKHSTYLFADTEILCLFSHLESESIFYLST